MSSSRWRFFLTLLMTLFLYVRASLEAQQEQPVFRTEVDVVEVDVSVVDEKGNPVQGLTAEDFTLLVDGVPRPLTHIDFVSFASDPGGSPPHPGNLAPYFSTNEGAPRGRLVVLAVDRGTIRRGEGREEMAAAAAFVDRLGPADRIGVFTMPQREILVNFTSDRARVKQALSGITGLATPVRGTFGLGLVEALAIADNEQVTLVRVVDRECKEEMGKALCQSRVAQEAVAIAQDARRQTRELISGLAYLLEELKTIEGPKTVILLAGGFVVDRETTVLLDPLGWSAASAGVSLYSLQLESISDGPSRFRSSPTRLQDSSVLTNGMASLAGMTRGALFRVSQAGQSVFARVERELAGYYLLSFAPTLSDRDGKPHEVVVRTSRDDVTVRSRTAFVIRREPRPSADAEIERLKGLLKNPLPATDLPMKVSTYSARDPAIGEPQVIVALEIGTEEAPPHQVSVAFALVDEGGNLVAQKLATSSQATGGRSPLRYVTPIPAATGRYILKLAAIDERGRLGSLEHPVHLQFASAGGLELSDLLVSEPAGGGGGAGTPLISSSSGDSSHFDIVLEIYTEEQSLTEGVAVSFEVAKGEEAPQLVVSEAAVNGTDQPSRWTAEGRLDLRSLEPDDYVARAIVTRDGAALAQITRPFRLVREPRSVEVPSEAPDVAFPSIQADLPTAYAKALNDYQGGNDLKAIQALSRMSPKTLSEAKQGLETAHLTDSQLSAVALIHTEVALKTGRNEVVHLGVARGLMERVDDPSRKEALLKNWLLLMGYHLHGLYRDQDAILFLQAGLDLAPKDDEILMALGTAHEASAWMLGSRDAIERAEDYYRKILKADRDNAEAHLRLGHVLKLKEKSKDALREIEWCLSHSDDREIELVARLLMGGLREEKNELAKAIESYRAAFDLDPRCQVAAAALSYALHRSGDMAGSRDVWARFIQGTEGVDPWLRYLHGSPDRIDAMLTRMRGEIQ